MNQITYSSIVNSQWKFCRFAKYTLLFVIFHISFITLNAQEVSASLDRNKILIGEQVTLQLNLGNVSNLDYFVANWPNLPDTLSHSEILKRSSIDTVTVNDANSYRQSFTLTSFDSGTWQIGPFSFVLQDKVTGKQTGLSTQPVTLTVLPVDVSSLKDFHPIKDIIEVQPSFNWKPVIITVIALLITIIIYFIIKKRKQGKTKNPEVVLKGTPLQRALKKLQALQDEKLSSPASIKKFHFEIDMIMRQYFEEMLEINALQLTITELFSRMSVYLQNAGLRSNFRKVFELNLSVKFAKYLPQQIESKATLEEIIDSLRIIDESVNRARNNADKLVSKY